MLTKEEQELAKRTVKANPDKRAACSRGGHTQKEYGTIFNKLGRLNSVVTQRLRAGLIKEERVQFAK